MIETQILTQYSNDNLGRAQATIAVGNAIGLKIEKTENLITITVRDKCIYFHIVDKNINTYYQNPHITLKELKAQNKYYLDPAGIIFEEIIKDQEKYKDFLDSKETMNFFLDSGNEVSSLFSILKKNIKTWDGVKIDGYGFDGFDCFDDFIEKDIFYNYPKKLQDKKFKYISLSEIFIQYQENTEDSENVLKIFRENTISAAGWDEFNIPCTINGFIELGLLMQDFTEERNQIMSSVYQEILGSTAQKTNSLMKKEFMGAVILRIDNLELGSKKLKIITTGGWIQMEESNNWGDDCTIEQVDQKPEDFHGAIITDILEKSINIQDTKKFIKENPDNNKVEKLITNQASFTSTFYTLVTSKGYLDFRWQGYSNGYYSEKCTCTFFDRTGKRITLE